MTEDEAKQEIDKLLEERPELQTLQYKIDCRLIHCKTFEERQEAYLKLFEEVLFDLNIQWLKLFKIMEKVNANDGFK